MTNKSTHGRFDPTSPDYIKINMTTGALSYRQPEGFKLDQDKMFSTAQMFAPHCGNIEQAIRQAIHSQISAFEGAQSLLRKR